MYFIEFIFSGSSQVNLNSNLRRGKETSWFHMQVWRVVAHFLFLVQALEKALVLRSYFFVPFILLWFLPVNV